MKLPAYPPDEVEAAVRAMRALRQELFGKPLGEIWTELAIAGLRAAQAARVKRIWSGNEQAPIRQYLTKENTNED